MLKNPATAACDLEEFFTREPRFESCEEVEEAMEYAYPLSVKDPESFMESELMGGGKIYWGRNFAWLGVKGRMLRVSADNAIPIEGNIFYPTKLSAIAKSPECYDFKIPMVPGYCAPYVMSQGHFDESVEYEDDYYTPNEDDVGEVFFQIRDGNHRTFGALISGEPYVWVYCGKNTLDEYQEWVKGGRLDTAWNYDLMLYLDENLE